MAENILEVNNLTVIKNNHTILDGVSFSVEKGDTVAIIGPNGAGKTTLFKAILGLTPHSGGVRWQKSIRIGFVPQKLYIENDLPLTTYEFFKLKSADKKKILAALNVVGLNNKDSYTDNFERHIFESRLGNLSGGELQRVLIAWSLLGDPDVLLYDEPTSGVDLIGEETVYAMLNHLKEKTGLTILLISHELDIVYKFTNKVLCLNKENICFGPPAKVINKSTLEKLFGEEVGIYGHKGHTHNF